MIFWRRSLLVSDVHACSECHEMKYSSLYASGWFHWRLLLITGLANAADGMEVSLLAFMSVCAGIDWDLSDSQIASIASVVFAGELVGSLIWYVCKSDNNDDEILTYLCSCRTGDR